MPAKTINDVGADMKTLEKQLQQHMRQRVLEQLQDNRQPQSVTTIARFLELHPAAVQGAVDDMLAAEQVSQVGVDGFDQPTFRPVEVGPCEWCGVVSHRLVAGECPQHRAAPFKNTSQTFSNVIGRPSREIQLPPLPATRIHPHEQTTEPHLLRSLRPVQQPGLRLVREATDRVRQDTGAKPPSRT